MNMDDETRELALRNIREVSTELFLLAEEKKIINGIGLHALWNVLINISLRCGLSREQFKDLIKDMMKASKDAWG